MIAKGQHRFWTRLGTRFLPLADAAREDLPQGRLLRG